MDIEKLEIYRAIGELAYVVAKADNGLSAEEKLAFYAIAQEELDYDSWAAQSRFDILDETVQPSIEKAYNEAIHEFKKYKDHLNDDLRAKSLRVLQRVAACCEGLSANEAFVLDRFRKDLSTL
jgi:uncharacterized tellurite resistance protein B-like protein